MTQFKRILYCLCFVLPMIASSHGAQAAIIFSIDWDPLAGGIQSDIATTAGSNVTANLVLELTGATSLSSYGFSLRFDTDELNFISRTETPPPGFAEIDFSNPFNENAGFGFAPIGTYGELRRFDGGALGAGITAPDQYVIASLVFTAVAPSGNLSDVDVLAGAFETLFDDVFDSNGDSLLLAGEVQFNGGSVSLQSGAAAVPEPGTFVLMASITACILVRQRAARSRRKQSAEMVRNQF